MKLSMLRMPSKDCQAGIGYLKRTEFVQARPKWDMKPDPSTPFISSLSHITEKQDFSITPL
jgi:hypothetical protein